MTVEVWTSRLDDKYEIKVVRTAPYQGLLTITGKDTILHTQSVGLMYDALFGPDVDDVMTWQNLAVDFIDKQ
jgi:hypothetical protein